MPRRTSLRDRVNPLPRALGREAIYGERDAPVDPAARARNGEPNGPETGPRWEAGHKRVTFYCSTELLAALEVEMARARQTKTQVIVHALTDHLSSRVGSSHSGRPGAGRA